MVHVKAREKQMKVAGILFMGLIAGVVAAAASVILGGGFWLAVLNYLAFGTAATILSVGILFWRAFEAERPGHPVALSGIQAATGK